LITRQLIPALACAVILTSMPDCASATVLGDPKPKHKRAGSNILADDDSPFIHRHPQTVYRLRAPAEARQRAKPACGRNKASVYTFLNCAKTWDSPAIIKIYPARPNTIWIQDSTARPDPHRSFRIREKRHASSWRSSIKDLKSTLRHEIVHLLVTDLANEGFFKGRDTERKVPNWIHEGVAEYIAASKAKKAEYRELIYAAGRAKLHNSSRRSYLSTSIKKHTPF